MSTTLVDVPATVDPATVAGAARIRSMVARHAGGLRFAACGTTLHGDGEGGQFRVLELTPDGAPPTRRLTVDAKASDGERLAAWARGEDEWLLSFDPAAGTAVVGGGCPLAMTIRDALARFLKVPPWTLTVGVDWRLDENLTASMGDLTVSGLPPFVSAEKASTVLREALMAAVPGANTGWGVAYDAHMDSATFTPGEPASLPAMVPLLPELPDMLDPSAWDTLPLGRGVTGEPVSVALRLGPHAVYVGPTGSGKSVTLIAHISQALARGHNVALVDVVKMGADFVPLRQFCSGWADTLADAEALMTRVYRVVEHRRQLCRDHAVGFWEDLPEEVREAHGVRPLTVVVDEYVSTVMPRTIPKGLPKGHPLLTEAEQANASKAVLAEYVGRIAREARFVGVHLALGTQRPDAAYLGGEMRSNLTSAIQMIKPGSIPAREALGMVFTSDQTAAAMETLSALDDGHSRGIGAIGAEGGGVAGVRIAYAPAREAAAALTALGVPQGRPLVTGDSATATETDSGSEWDLGGAEW